MGRFPERFKEDRAIFRRLIVLLDNRAPLQGAFAYALEWAWHLRLPVHAWVFPTLDSAGYRPAQLENSEPCCPPQLYVPASDEFATIASACATVCAERGVKLGLTPMEEDPAHAFRQYLHADDLLILSHGSGVAERQALIRHVLQQPVATLICPDVWKSTLSRMLILYQGRQQNQDALTLAMELCCCVRTRPVVLTVAPTQREGRRLQQPARAAFAEHGQEGNFDLLIGADIVEAAARVARWRQCQLLVIGRYGRPEWRRWVSGSTTEQLIDLANSFAVLTIPQRRAIDLDRHPTETAPVQGQDPGGAFRSSGFPA